MILLRHSVPTYVVGSGRARQSQGVTRYGPNAGLILSLAPAAWYRFGIGITVEGQGVSVWADQSGNGRDLLQGTDGARPILQADGSFITNGTDEFLQTGAFTLNQPCTYYVLGRQITFTTADRIIDGVGALAAIQQGAATPTIRLNAPDNANANAGFALNTYGVLAAVFNGAASLLQVNNGTPATGDPADNNPGGITLATNIIASGNFCHFQYKEVIVYPVAHDAATRLKVIRYLSRVGGLGI